MVPWYHMMKKNGTISSWSQLLKAIELAYGPSSYEDPSYALFNLKQDNSVTTIITLSQLLLIGLMEYQHSHYYLVSLVVLKKNIQRNIIPWQPSSIPKGMT